MLKRALVFVTLFSMLNLIVQCTKTVREPASEIAQKSRNISGLVVNPADTVFFDERGGNYDPVSMTFKGVSQDGSPVNHRLKNVRYVIADKPDESGSVKQVFHTAREFQKLDKSIRDAKVIKAIMKDGSVVTFIDEGARYDSQSRSIRGVTVVGRVVELAINDVSYVMVKRSNPTLTAIVVGSIVVAAVVLAAAAGGKEAQPSEPSSSDDDVQSCPLVYSWDGEKYVLEAEPLGGAVTRALERTDLSVLEYAACDRQGYDVLLTNEMREIQYLNEVSLLLVDHPEETSIAPDGAGGLKIYSDPMPPLTATDETGQNLLNFIDALDNVCWQTDMSLAQANADHRHHLAFRFERPPGTTTARLVYSAGTSLWGSHMIRSMHEAAGDNINAFHETMLKGGLPMLQAFSFFDREELFWLKVRVDNGQESVARGLILGGGPLVYQTHVVDLDISDIPGDTLTVRLDPPRGFWSFDYVGIDYNQHPEPRTIEVPIATAVDNKGSDVSERLLRRDLDYYVMPTTSDWIEVRFDVPETDLRGQRTVVLKTSGYYNLLLDRDRPLSGELVGRTMATPGAIVKYSLAEYAAWSDSILASIQSR